MQPILDKVFAALFYPLGLTLLLLCAAGIVGLRGRARSAAALSIAALVLLWVGSTPALSGLLVRTLEAPFPPVAAADLPHADAIVLLGGVVSSVDAAGEHLDVARSFDRVLLARDLYAAGRAPLVIVSGGSLTGGRPEAELIAPMLSDLGVSPQAMMLEKASRNTYENALGTARILAQQELGDVLLVTSASHMRRALASFEAQGIDAVPAPTDHKTRAERYGVLDWLPSAAALSTTSDAIKEYLGLLVYRLRGWAT